MNYGEHLKKHEESIARHDEVQQRSVEDRLIALRVSCEEAEQIIHSVVQPEMEKLEAALCEAGKKCVLKLSKRRFIEIVAEFEIVIEIEAGELHSQLKFEADPQSKTFIVLHQDQRLRHGKKQATHLYGDVTPDLVSTCCGEFIRLAFPA